MANMQKSANALTDKLAKMEEENRQLKAEKERRPPDEGDLPDIDEKDVEKPAKYRGDALKRRHGLLKFKAFLARRDRRWVTLLDAPATGTLVGLQALMGAPFGSPACGSFLVALWFPFGDVEFADYPSWVSPVPVTMHPSDEPYVWLLLDPPQVPEGPVRIGLIAYEDCPNGQPQPALLSDTSGDVSGTWLYAPNPGGVALVPGEALGATGRWVLRALIEVELQ